MGKATDNERIKLRATFFNNLAVGLILAGVLIPYLGILDSGKFDNSDAVIRDFLAGNISTHGPVLLKIFTFLVVIFCAAILRYAAVIELQKLQD
jgi:hypothetical protein